MTRILGTFFILVSIRSGVSDSVVSLTFVSGSAREGENLTMKCTVNSGLQNASWIRNNVSIFSTSNGTLTAIKTENSTFNLVAGRMIVTTSDTQHNVNLKINSTLDGGSMWQCMVGDEYSSQLEISVLSTSLEVSSSQAVTSVTSEKSTSDIGSIMPATEDSSVPTTTAQTTKEDTSGISSRNTAKEDSSVPTTTAQTTKEDTSGISSRNTAKDPGHHYVFGEFMFDPKDEVILYTITKQFKFEHFVKWCTKLFLEVDSTTSVLPAQVSTTTSTAFSDTVALTTQTSTIPPHEESTTRRTTPHPTTGIIDKTTASTTETIPSLGRNVSPKDQSIYIVIGSIVGVITIYICIMIIMCGTRNKRIYSPRKVSKLKRQRPNHDSQDGNDNPAMTASDSETEFGSVHENRTIDDVEEQMPDEDVFAGGNLLSMTASDSETEFGSVHDNRTIDDVEEQMPDEDVFADSGNDGYPDPQNSRAGDPQYNTAGDPQYSTAVDPQYSTAGDPQYSTAGDPQHSTDWDPQYSTAGDPQYSTDWDPQYSTAGDPQYSTDWEPQYSTDWDSQYSTVGENHYIAAGEIGETAEGRSVMKEGTQVTDVYAQVQKKGDIAVTDDQVEVNVDDLYAKPIKDKFCIRL